MSGVTRDTVAPSLLDLKLWAGIDPSKFPEDDHARIKRLELALTAYVQRRPMRALLRELKLSRTQLLRAFKRCITFHPDGQLYGWRGLLQGAARKAYERKKPATTAAGSAGALHQLFTAIPGLRERLTNLILKRNPNSVVHEARISNKDLHAAFIGECRAGSVPVTQWPFTARQLGRRSIDRFMREVINTHPERAARSRYGQVAVSKLFTGTGEDRLMLAVAPFDVAEMDGHRIDMIGAVGIPTPQGVVWVPIERIQLLLIVDGCSGAIMAYFAVVRRECRSSDILEAAVHLALPWKPRVLRIPGMAYRDGAGLPLGVVPGLKACAFAALMVDNALINIGFAVTDRLRSRLGCAVNWGPVRKWMRRSLIERINKALEEAGFQRMVSTTGSHPKDPRRDDPVGAAVRHCLHLEELLDLIDVVIANYNATSSEGHFSLSPLEVLAQTATGNACPTLLPELPPVSGFRAELNRLVFNATIRGSLEKGRRPAIKFERQNYTNKVIARDFKLVKEPVLLHVNPNDIRVLEVYLARTGASLGMVRVLGRWRRHPHTLEFRRQINRAIADKRLVVPVGTDPVTAMHAALKRRAAKHGRKRRPTVSVDATTLAREWRATGLVTGPVAPPPPLPRSFVRSRRAPSFGRHL